MKKCRICTHRVSLAFLTPLFPVKGVFTCYTQHSTLVAAPVRPARTFPPTVHLGRTPPRMPSAAARKDAQILVGTFF